MRTTREDKRVKLYIDVPQNVVDQFLSLWVGRRR
jgi:hypothetical protein